MATSNDSVPQSAVGRLWDRFVALPTTRFIEGIILRRQVERLYLVFGGHIFFQTLRTAVQLDLFTLLAKEGPLTRQEIAKRLGIAEQPARIVVLGLTVVGFLRKRGERYSNSYLAGLLLDKNSPRKITAYVELQHRAMYKGLFWMLESVREYRNVGLKEFPGDEPTLYQRLAHDPEVEQIFQEAMQELSVQANADMARFVDLRGVKHLVDVGGGDGTNIIAMARRWPHLRATVFDSPTVCEIARKNIAASGLANRLDAVPGECFADPFPKDADCLMFAHFFTIWGEKKDRELLRKCHDSLPSGGKVIIFNMMQHDDETGPLSAAVGSPYFLALATGLGMLYTWREYATWMQEAGFQGVHQRRLLRDHGLLVGIKR
jgi:SAM-dependent methyltransferase